MAYIKENHHEIRQKNKHVCTLGVARLAKIHIGNLSFLTQGIESQLVIYCLSLQVSQLTVSPRHDSSDWNPFGRDAFAFSKTQ